MLPEFKRTVGGEQTGQHSSVVCMEVGTGHFCTYSFGATERERERDRD